MTVTAHAHAHALHTAPFTLSIVGPKSVPGYVRLCGCGRSAKSRQSSISFFSLRSTTSSQTEPPHKLTRRYLQPLVAMQMCVRLALCTTTSFQLCYYMGCIRLVVVSGQ
jgi:hypothetical protein